MSRVRKVFKYVLLAVVLGGAAQIAWAYIHPCFRFRLTVMLETPDGLHSGSGVMEVSAASRVLPLLPEEASGALRLKGEAVAIETPQQTYFALLKGKYDMGWVAIRSLAPASLNGFSEVKKAVDFLGSSEAIHRRAVVAKDEYPIVVFFSDMTSPSTIKPSDIKIHSVMVEVVSESLTDTITSRLPWLATLNDRMLDGTRLHWYDGSRGFANQFSQQDFKVF